MIRSPGCLAYPLRDALYLNLTNACTLSCSFCPKVRDHDLTLGELNLKLTHNPSAEELWTATLDAGLSGYREVVFTGFGESTLRLPVLLDVTARLKQAGVVRVRLDTDGLANLREGRNVVPALARAGLDAVSVSLNAPDAATYAQLCRSRYGENAWHAACDFIRSARVDLREVTASFVALPGLSRQACSNLAASLGAQFRWRPFVSES